MTTKLKKQVKRCVNKQVKDLFKDGQINKEYLPVVNKNHKRPAPHKNNYKHPLIRTIKKFFFSRIILLSMGINFMYTHVNSEHLRF